MVGAGAETETNCDGAALEMPLDWEGWANGKKHSRLYLNFCNDVSARTMRGCEATKTWKIRFEEFSPSPALVWKFPAYQHSKNIFSFFLLPPASGRFPSHSAADENETRLLFLHRKFLLGCRLFWDLFEDIVTRVCW